MFIISDLHAGDGKQRDNFAYNNRKAKLSTFLDYVDSQKEHLCILGDLFDLWQMNLGSILIYNKDIMDRLIKMDFSYVTGNHDIDLFPLIDSEILKDDPFFSHMIHPFINIINNKKIKFFHSHELDGFNADLNPDWGRILSIFSGLAEDNNGSPKDREGRFVEIKMQNFGEKLLDIWYYLARIFHPRTKMSHPKNHLNIRQRKNKNVYLEQHFDSVEKDKIDNNYDIAVVGHTHVVGKRGDWYCNSGSWAEDMNNFIHINEVTGEIKTYDWQDSPKEINVEL